MDYQHYQTVTKRMILITIAFSVVVGEGGRVNFVQLLSSTLYGLHRSLTGRTTT